MAGRSLHNKRAVTKNRSFIISSKKNNQQTASRKLTIIPTETYNRIAPKKAFPSGEGGPLAVDEEIAVSPLLK